jgi:hypothetical protein
MRVFEDSLHPEMSRREKENIRRKFRKVFIIATPFNKY